MAYTTIDDPSAYFQTTLYAGNGSADHSITNSGNSDLQPDWVWIKNRAATDVHCLFDSVRGVTKLLTTVGDVLETTDGDTLDAFQSDGFRVDADVKVNTNNENYVSWQWKAGTSVSGNTTGSGSATAYSGSVNTDSGFSIITYEANGTAGHTIPHHLGVAPKMVICKSISENRGWPIQHASLTSAAYAIFLSTTGPEANNGADQSTNTWNSTAASSTVVTLGNNANNNKNGDDYIMYSFAEKQGYSKFGIYDGNNNVDGTFVYLGFKPAFLMVKQVNANGNPWGVVDGTRSPDNPTNEQLISNTNGAEITNVNVIDLLSNGFKCRAADNTWNGEAGGSKKYLYMAFAEQPLVTSTGVPATAR